MVPGIWSEVAVAGLMRDAEVKFASCRASAAGKCQVPEGGLHL